MFTVASYRERATTSSLFDQDTKPDGHLPSNILTFVCLRALLPSSSYGITCDAWYMFMFTEHLKGANTSAADALNLDDINTVPHQCSSTNVPHQCCCGTLVVVPWWRHKWKYFPRSWPFVREIHQSSVKSPHKRQWRGVWCFLWSAPE